MPKDSIEFALRSCIRLRKVHGHRVNCSLPLRTSGNGQQRIHIIQWRLVWDGKGAAIASRGRVYYPPSRDLSDAFAVDESELLIARAERGDELRHGLVALQSTKIFDGFEDASGDPA